MGKKTTKIQVKAKPKKQAIKPKMGKGTGGVLTARIIADVNKNKK